MYFSLKSIRFKLFGNNLFNNFLNFFINIGHINIISALKSAINNDWEKLEGFIKLGGFVNCDANFVNHPKIINGASDLLVKIFGEQGKHARFAVGANSLPRNVPVEVDAIFEIS